MTNEEYFAYAQTRITPKREKEVGEKTLESVVKQHINRLVYNGYKIDEPKIIEAVIEYTKGYGIMLAGAVGIGKTHFFKCINPDIVVLDMNLAVRWDYSTLESFLAGVRDRELLVDDIGVSTGIASDYGVRYDALLIILNDRHHCRKATHFTTNLSNSQLISAYDYRSVDRIYGLAKIFNLPARVSRREPKRH